MASSNPQRSIRSRLTSDLRRGSGRPRRRAIGARGFRSSARVASTDWRSARQAWDVGQSDIARLGFTRLGKEWILPVTSNKVTKQAAIIADLEPATAQALCADYQARKLFCQVKKPQEIVAPFGLFWR